MTARLNPFTVTNATRIPRRVLHLALYYLLLRKHHAKHRLPVWKCACSAYKNQHLKNRLSPLSSSGKALCLLKTQFAKKPKNPV